MYRKKYGSRRTTSSENTSVEKVTYPPRPEKVTYPFSEQQLLSLLGGQITDMTTTAAKGGTFQNEQFLTQNGAS